jgi:outer membrane receptor for ferrienterochelin and colicins
MPFPKNKHISNLSILIFLTSISYGQKVRIIDKDTKKPVAFASIALYDLDSHNSYQLISDTSGFFILPNNNYFSVSIQALSYSNFEDTLSGNINQIITLEPSHYNINKIIVTGRIKPTLIDKSVYKINVLDRKQIELNAANDLGEILKTTIGFQYRSEGVLGDFIRIQGLSGEHIKILIDGVPISGRTGSIIDLSQINLQYVDHVEIIEGPMSVIYGSNAMAVINIITTQQPVNKSLAGEVTVNYETVGRYNFQSNISLSKKKHNLGGYLVRNFNSGWSPGNYKRFNYYKPKVQYSGGLYYWLKTNRYDMSIKSDLLFEELRDLDSIHLNPVYNEQLDSSYLTFQAFDHYHYTTRVNNRFNYRRILNPKTWIGFQASFSYYKKRKALLIKDLVTLNEIPAGNNASFDTSFYHSSMVKLSAYTEKISKTEINSGITYSYEKSISNRTQGKQNISNLAVYSNLLYKPFNYLNIQSGLRYIINSSFKAPVIYSLNALYIYENMQFRASYSNSFRAPSVKELFFQFIDNNHFIIGNPDLLAENGRNFTVNGKYNLVLTRITFSPQITLFQNTIENAIQLALNLNKPGWGYYVNIPSSTYKTKGYNFQLKSNFLKNVTLQLGISTTGKSKLYESGQYYYSTDLTTNFTYVIPKVNLSTNLHYKYTSPYLDYVGNFNDNLELSGITEQRFDSYHTMNIVLNKKLVNNRLTVSTGIKNLFNVSLIETKGALNVHGGGENSTLAGYGRSYFIKISYFFSKPNE